MLLQNKRQRRVLHLRTFKVTQAKEISSEREFIGNSDSIRIFEKFSILRLYKQFSRKWSNLGHFLKFEKNQYEHMIHSIEARDTKIFRICDYFREILRFMNVFTIFTK